MAPTWLQSHPSGTNVCFKATPFVPKWPMKPHCNQPASPTKPSRLLKAWCQGFKISKLLRARGRRVGLCRSSPWGTWFQCDSQERLKCVKTVELSSISLFWPFQGRVLAPCGSHGSPRLPKVTPLVLQSHPLGSQMADIVTLWGAHGATLAPQECQI